MRARRSWSIAPMTDAAAKAEFGCPYMPAYSSRCNGIKTASGFCKGHTGKACSVCGEQATRECNHTGQFVCGAPLCPNCEPFTDTTKPSGSWGFMNHGHRPIMRAQKPRTMTADDIGVSPR